MILGGNNAVGNIILGLVVIGSIVGLIALFIYFMNDESSTTNKADESKMGSIVPIDPLSKYTKVANRYALLLNPDYGKDPSVTHRTKYYPESKEWQAVKPTHEGLLLDNPGLCAAECDKYPKCKSFYWDSGTTPGKCFLGTGFDETVNDDIGETSTTYYKT